jgi:uncharacterized protein involved in outer membrane biogenesis
VAVVHIYLAIWVRDYVNRKLSEIHGYRAHVAAVTLHMWRGAYQIHNLDVVKTNGDVPVPFFSAPLIDFNVQWKALIFERSFVGEIQLYRPKMNLVNGPTEASRQAPVDEPWAQKIKQLYPLKINRFSVQDGQVHYRDFSKRLKVDVAVDHVQMVATNLTNSKKTLQDSDCRGPGGGASIACRARPDADVARSLCGRADLRVECRNERNSVGQAQ